MNTVTQAVAVDSSATQSPQQAPTIAERTNRTLLKIIRANFNTQYAAQAPILSAFRDAVGAHGGTDVDATLLADFRAHVPLSNYDCYKPFVEKFHEKRCTKEYVENLLAPGLPEFIAASSATTGPAPKILPKYSHRSTPPRCPFFSPDSENPVAAVTYCGCMDLKEIVDATGQEIQKIPVFSITGGSMRRCFGWKVEDDQSRMSRISTCFPWKGR